MSKDYQGTSIGFVVDPKNKLEKLNDALANKASTLFNGQNDFPAGFSTSTNSRSEIKGPADYIFTHPIKTMTAIFAFATAATFLSPTKVENNEASKPEDSMSYMAGHVAGELKRGFDAGLEGTPPCVPKPRENKKCESSIKDTGHSVGYNAALFMRGFQGH